MGSVKSKKRKIANRLDFQSEFDYNVYKMVTLKAVSKALISVTVRVLHIYFYLEVTNDY